MADTARLCVCEGDFAAYFLSSITPFSVAPAALKTYAKQMHVLARKYYGPATQTQLTKVGDYPAISTASYRADKSGRKALIWTVSVFTPRWNYLFYTVADAASAKQVVPAFDAVLRSLSVTK